jgi:hypothetical protein
MTLIVHSNQRLVSWWPLLCGASKISIIRQWYLLGRSRTVSTPKRVLEQSSSACFILLVSSDRVAELPVFSAATPSLPRETLPCLHRKDQIGEMGFILLSIYFLQNFIENERCYSLIALMERITGNGRATWLKTRIWIFMTMSVLVFEKVSVHYPVRASIETFGSEGPKTARVVYILWWCRKKEQSISRYPLTQRLFFWFDQIQRSCFRKQSPNKLVNSIYIFVVSLV